MIKHKINCKSGTDENLYELEGSDIRKLANDLVYRVGGYFGNLGYKMVNAFGLKTKLIADDIFDFLNRTFFKKEGERS